MIPRTLAATVLTVSLTAATVAAPPGRPAGVDVVPATSFAFASVKAADLWDSAALKPGRDALLKGQPFLVTQFEKVMGFGVADVERVTLFWPTLPIGGEVPFTVITTRKPYNEAKVLRAMQARPADRLEHGITSGKMPAPRKASGARPDVKSGIEETAPKPRDPEAAEPKDPCTVADTPAADNDDRRDHVDLLMLEDGLFTIAYLLDERSLLLVPRNGRAQDTDTNLISLLGQLLRGKTDGPLAASLDLTAQHTIVAAVRVEQIETAIRRFPIPREVVPFRSLLRARLATLTADVADVATVSARLSFADAATARRGEPVLATLIQLAGEGLATAHKEAGQDEYLAPVLLPLLDLATQALEKAEVKTDGSTVTARLKADIGPAVAKAVVHAPQMLHAAAERNRAINNLKMIGLAIHSYHDVYGVMPTDILDAAGKPILSWRVQILPFLEQDHLYKQLDPTKPWDHPTNARFAAQMPEVFRVLGRDPKEPGMTYLQMPSTDKPLEGGSPIKVRGQKARIISMTDGTSNTLMVVEATDPVAWMKPDDVQFDPKALPKLGDPTRGQFVAMFGDGSVREFHRKKLNDEVLRALLTANGGEVVSYPD